MSERLMAQGKLQELKLQVEQRKLAVEEARRAIREATSPIVDTQHLESDRVLFLAGELALALESTEDGRLGLRPLLAEIAKLCKEYGL